VRGRRAGFAPVLYRFLLVASMPGDLRARYLDDMVLVFRELHRDARARGMGAVLGVWWRAVTQVVGGGFRDRFHRRREKRVQKPPQRKGIIVLDHLMQDLRFAYRSFVRQPWFSLTAIGIVALGIGATTAIFSVVDGVVLRKLSYPDPERLIYFDEASHTVPDYKSWLERLTAFESIAAVWPTRRTLLGQGPPQQVAVGQATANLLPTFGGAPARGRWLTADDMAGDARVAVLAHDFWMRQFGGDESVVGRTIHLDDMAYTVVGLAPAGFAVPGRMSGQRIEVWTPLAIDRAEYDNRGLYTLRVVGRLAEGASLELARSQMTAWEEAMVEAYPEDYVYRDGTSRHIPLLTLRDAVTVDVRQELYMLFGAVGLMLLIACANVANLLLARGTDRQRELAVRAALGAGRGRIAMQLLTESVTLAVAGAVLGVAVAGLGVAGFGMLAPADVPRLQEVSVDVRTLGFALAVAVLTGVVFGVLPSFYASRAEVTEALKEGAGRASAGHSRLRVKNGLVVGEIALALVLLVGAGLLFNSFVRLKRVDPGFDPGNLISVPLTFGSLADLTRAHGPARLQALREIMGRVRALPGVQSVSAAAVVPFSQIGRCCYMTTAVTESGGDSTRIVRHPVAPGFFETLHASLVAGRDVVWSDADAPEHRVVISRSMAERFFGDENPVGKTFTMGRNRVPATVIGVVNDLKFWNLARDRDVDVFFPYDSSAAGDLSFMHLAVRTSGSVEGVPAALRRAIWSVEPEMPIPEIQFLPARISETMTSERFLSTLLVVFAGFAVTLAAAGIYGTMLYAVGQRSHEIGIRMALGADGRRIVVQVLKRGMALTVVGVGLGLAGAVAVSRVLESLVFGISAQDVPTYGAVAVLLTFVALAACYLPARRASRLDPMITLRAE
jgi:predicted permease